jgi:hypothetical protein
MDNAITMLKINNTVPGCKNSNETYNPVITNEQTIWMKWSENVPVKKFRESTRKKDVTNSPNAL